MNKPLSISGFEFEAWIDGRDNRFMIRAQRPEGSEGPRYISFYMGDDELKQFADNHFSFTLDDITHRLHISGDVITFYDFEIPMKSSGTMQIPFVKVSFPWYARRILFRIASRIWKGLRANYSEERKYDVPRVRFSFTESQGFRLEKKYGSGSGSVKLNIQEEIANRFESDRNNPCQHRDGLFSNQFDRLMCIARNSTHASWEQSKLNIYKDGDSYFWTATSSKNKQIMHGGLINHARNGESPRWSIHT